MKNPHKMFWSDLGKYENDFLGMNALNKVYYINFSVIPVSSQLDVFRA